MNNRKHILLIGYGAIGATVSQAMAGHAKASISHVLIRPGRQTTAQQVLGTEKHYVSSLSDLLNSDHSIDVVVDCAGHAALQAYGVQLLAAGIDVISLSCGALADAKLSEALRSAAEQGQSQLKLLSGAIGGLDALAAGAVGGLTSVTYRGCKPPQGWKGSVAEDVLDLDTVSRKTAHYTGPARTAASRYPKNANVAAAVAVAGTGFEHTTVELMVDPSINNNVHEIEASGKFGSLNLRVEGYTLENNPRSSALAAYSMICALKNRYAPFIIG